MIADWLSPVEGTITEENSIQQQLEDTISREYTGYLKVSAIKSDIVWRLYFRDGQLTYASHSVDITDRIDRHLRKLSKRVPQLTKVIRSEIRQTLMSAEGDEDASPDYRAIAALVSQQHLSESQAGILVKGLIEEVMESLLLVRQGTYRYLPALIIQPMFCSLKVKPLVAACEHRYQLWKGLGASIWSPYQRPYFFSQNAAKEAVSEETSKKLAQILRGFSFRHLSVLLDRDELALAKNLSPLIQKQVILVRPPQSPYDLLPDLRNYQQEGEVAISNDEYVDLDAEPVCQKAYTIACVDDSPSILNTIHRYLENEALKIVQINQPTRALLEIVRATPDLILMDVGMPQIDGYALCRMLRKHQKFRDTPIIMVTGNTGLIDRAKAKIVGATDYMTKPFTQEGLSNMVFRYLSD